MNSDVNVGFVFEHMSVKPVVVQKLDARATLLVFLEDVDVKRNSIALQSVDIWLGHSVTVMFDITTPKQLSMADFLKWLGGDEVTSGEDGNVQLFRPLSDPLCGISSFSVAPPIVGKTCKFSIFSDKTAEKGGFIQPVGV